MLSSISIANSAERRPEAASQKCSIAPVMRRRDLGRELGRLGEVERPDAPGGGSVDVDGQAGGVARAGSIDRVGGLAGAGSLARGGTLLLGSVLLGGVGAALGLTVASLSALARGDLDGRGIASVGLDGAGRGCHRAGARAASPGEQAMSLPSRISVTRRP